jgi:apolipoprotein D and lipocalin family protein
MRAVLLTALVLLAAPSAAALHADRQPLRVVEAVDYARYAGDWFEIARLPNRFQEDCAGEVVATYRPREDGRLTVTNRCRTADGTTKRASGVARRVDGRPTSVLEVRFAPAILGFLPAVWGDYQVIALGTDYDHAMVGTPDREYLWILSRTPQMEPDIYQRLLDQAKGQGFDVTKVVRTRQEPAS